MNTNALGDYVAAEVYRKTRELVFPSPGSLEWFLRQNRATLADSGAVLFREGRALNLIHPAKMDEVTEELILAASKVRAATAAGEGSE